MPRRHRSAANFPSSAPSVPAEKDARMLPLLATIAGNPLAGLTAPDDSYSLVIVGLTREVGIRHARVRT